MKTKLIKFTIGAILILYQVALTAEIIEQQSLNFGTVLVISNNSPESFTIQKNGFVTNTAGIRIMNNHQPAIFYITGLNPNSVYDVEVDIATPEMVGDIASAETFNLSIADYDKSVRADSLGAGQIRVGGTITTSGLSNLNFEVTTFQAQFIITINR